jgi:hypothetical protein
MARSTQQTRLLYADPDHCVAIHGSAVLSLSLQPPNASFLEAWAAAIAQLATQAPSAISVLTVIDAGARPPDEASKAAIKATVLRHRRQIGVFAYAIEGRGFAAAAQRSALCLISLAARYPFPQRVFADVPGAIAWSLEQMPGTPAATLTARGITDALDEMRRRLTRVAATG